LRQIDLAKLLKKPQSYLSDTLQNRYQQLGQPRLLLEARIKREHAVLMLERNEQEIIATKIIRPVKTLELGVCLK
jgi:hypothetical protein